MVITVFKVKSPKEKYKIETESEFLNQNEIPLAGLEVTELGENGSGVSLKQKITIL